MVWFGRELQRSYTPTSLQWAKDIHSYTRFFIALLSLTLTISRDGTTTTSLDNLFRCFTIEGEGGLHWQKLSTRVKLKCLVGTSLSTSPITCQVPLPGVKRMEMRKSQQWFVLYSERIKILAACKKEMAYSWHECLHSRKIMAGS